MICFLITFTSTIPRFNYGYSTVHVLGGTTPEVLNMITPWTPGPVDYDPCPAQPDIAGDDPGNIPFNNFKVLNGNPAYNVEANNIGGNANDVLYTEFIFNMALFALVGIITMFWLSQRTPQTRRTRQIQTSDPPGSVRGSIPSLSPQETLARERRIYLQYCYGGAAVICIIYMCVSVPIHKSFTGSARSFYVLDVGLNNSWHDCFSIPRPADQLGFISDWYEWHKSRTLNLLSLA